MVHMEGVAQNQVILFPNVIDDYIEDDDPVQYGYLNHIRSSRSLEKETKDEFRQFIDRLSRMS